MLPYWNTSEQHFSNVPLGGSVPVINGSGRSLTGGGLQPPRPAPSSFSAALPEPTAAPEGRTPPREALCAGLEAARRREPREPDLSEECDGFPPHTGDLFLVCQRGGENAKRRTLCLFYCTTFCPHLFFCTSSFPLLFYIVLFISSLFKLSSALFLYVPVHSIVLFSFLDHICDQLHSILLCSVL